MARLILRSALRIRYAIAVALLLLGPSSSADPLPEPQKMPRVLSMSTAWLTPESAISVSTGSELSRKAPFAAITAGLAGVAEVELVVDKDHSVWLPSAQFKVGVPEQRFFSWQPAIAVGLRKSFGDDHRLAELYGVVTFSSRPIRLHMGADVWQARKEASEVGPVVRPSLGVEWTPWIAPRSTVLAEVGWEPRLTEPGKVTLGWRIDWGVRARITKALAIDLGVRMRESDALDEPTVFLRLNALFQGTGRKTP